MARILVVDDEASIREILSRRLTQWGHEVVTANGAEAALTEMAVSPAQIVFSDVIMPVLDGVWLAREIRDRWPDAIVVAVSGAQEMETVVNMRKCGASISSPSRSAARCFIRHSSARSQNCPPEHVPPPAR